MIDKTLVEEHRIHQIALEYKRRVRYLAAEAISFEAEVQQETANAWKAVKARWEEHVFWRMVRFFKP